MTAAKISDPHITKEGTQQLLDYWLYGLLKSAAELGTADLVLRKVEEAAVSRFTDRVRAELRGARTAEEAVRRYLAALDRDGIMDQRDVTVRADGNRLRVSIGALCPYRTVCNWANAEQPLHRCFRVISLSEAIHCCTGHRYDGKLDRFSLPCELTLYPSQVGAD